MKRLLIPVAALFLAAAAVQCADETGERPKPLKGKAVLMVIAPKHFRDEELAEPKKLFQDAGAKVTVGSTTTKEVKGMLGAKVKPDMLIKKAKVADYDAVVFVGGSGAAALFDDADARRLAKKGVAQKKVVAAICIAPCILAKAGVLKGKKATVYRGAQFTRILKAGGATVLKSPVVTDGRIVTANGPAAAETFGKAVIKSMTAIAARK